MLPARAFALLLALPSALVAATVDAPRRLTETGLYGAGPGWQVRPENISFSPQYPLWSDGAAKRRWLFLPAGTAIDASNPDAWQFPPGTRLWKEFGYAAPVETRFIERLADGSWRYAAYAWNADGRDATLVPAGGVTVPVAAAPGGRYPVPAQDDCRACHEGGAVPVLGVSALQLSPDRDPRAPHAESQDGGNADLASLVARGLVRGLPPALLETPPRIAAPTAAGRAALGYLHGNCGHCHNDAGPLAPLELSLAQGALDPPASWARTLASLLGVPSRFQPAEAATPAPRARPGHGDSSVLAVRMRSRDPLVQMPPLGTRIPDSDGLALVEQWIQNELPTPMETPR